MLKPRMSPPALVTKFFLAVAAFLPLLLVGGCGGAQTPPVPAPPSMAFMGLTAADVQNVITSAAVSVDVPIVIAVTDRGGKVLGVFQQNGAPATSVANFGVPV